jgi:ABC-type nitrate/sulfonate/bicarbonate transport system substrate-binding protein
VKRIAFALTIVLAVAAGVWLTYTRTVPRDTGPPLVLRVTSGNKYHSALVYLAEDQGFFRKQGLAVQLTQHETGLVALKEMLAGRADAALAAEFVFVSQVAAHPDLRILGTIARLQTMSLAALAGRGINGTKDLSGLRVGLARGTQAEFFLALALTMTGLRQDQVQVVDLKPKDLEAALVAGTVDAVLVWEPFVQRMRTSLGKRLVAWPAQGDRNYFWSLISTQSLLAAREETFRRFFRALSEAEALAARQPEMVKALVGILVGEGSGFAAELLPRIRYRVSVEQALLVVLEDEWRWLAQTGSVRGVAAPDFLTLIRPEILGAVAPEKVTLRSDKVAR